ncbi:GAF domain-containing protein [Neokomagataea tanensis]|uniref:histidine kinase n=1 Tax=Neokomagataea tanensis TaxID=661191 RepID=A0A4Y6V6V9_9PROT|nr:GAF domain-containing protein [Neokomagataea tanensis]
MQSYGLLLVAHAENLKIISGAGELEDRLCPDWLGRSLSEILAIPEEILRQKQPSPHNACIREISGQALSIILHYITDFIIAELEPQPIHPLDTSQILGDIDSIAERFERGPNVTTICRQGADAFRRITGFDRVLVFQFLDNGNGRVVAESRNDNFPSLIHHHFPASDIPKQARALYLQNRVRSIPDARTVAAPLRPALPELAMLDLSSVQMRAISPVHLQYMLNMDVTASASVSLVIDGVLWGLLTCHHKTPHLLTRETRTICRTFAGIMSRQIHAKEELITYQERLRLKNILDTIPSYFIISETLETALRINCLHFMKLLPCDGFAVVSSDGVSRHGMLPPNAALHEIQIWLMKHSPAGLYTHDHLQEVYPPAAAWPDQMAGLTAITLPFAPTLTLIWSRAEVIQTIEWAGNPHKLTDTTEGVLQPRHSFDTWRQTVTGRTLPWSNDHIQAASKLRQLLLTEHHKRMLTALNTRLEATLLEREALLEEKDIFIREVNHRVQNSLQMVSAFLHLQSRSAHSKETASALNEAQKRVSAINLVHRRLYQDKHLGVVDLGRYLEELIEDVVTSCGPEWRKELQVSLTSITLEVDRAIHIGLIVTELLINASKYAYGGQAGPLHISLTQRGERLTLQVADQGESLGSPSKGEGFGRRMIRHVVGTLGGTMEYTDLQPGLSATLSLPIH